jgi:hypothetical protein
MIKIPKPPKQPHAKSSVSVWKDHIARLSQWVHVLDQVDSYSKHKYAVKKMGLRELGESGEWEAPRFKAKKRPKKR